MELRRVVVTGIGALTPIGNTKEEFFRALKEGRSGSSNITRFDASNFKTKFACEVKNFDPLEFIDKKEARRFDTFLIYGLVAGMQAVKDSGLDLEKIDKYRVGVVWGSGIGGLGALQEGIMDFAAGNRIPRFSPYFIPKIIVDMIPGVLSMRFGFRGPNYSTVSACSSSSHAIYDSFNLLRLGKAEVVVTGGSEATINETGVGGFNALKALSERNDSPETASRPYDKDRDGFVLGEGGGGLILESLEHALSRDAKIYCEVLGGGLSADAYHMTAPHPEGLGVIRVMQEAIREAGVRPEDIQYINSHGTSTRAGDGIELEAIKTVFGDYAPKLSISSTKSMTGHLLGAAGVIETIAIIMTLQESIIPPTINHFVDDPLITDELDLTYNKSKKREVEVAMNNTFGFGGHNASIVFGKYRD